MFLLHHCKQFFTRIKKYNKEILALDAKDVISTFFLKKKKERKKETLQDGTRLKIVHKIGATSLFIQ